MDIIFLVAASFFTSALTAVVGMGGGMLLISFMPTFLPIAAVVPVHGAVQIASNASRVLFGLRHIEWRIFWPFLGGAILGVALGSPLVMRLPSEHMPLLLVLWVLSLRRTWRLLPPWSLPFRSVRMRALFCAAAYPRPCFAKYSKY
ncbi:MAG: putative membrane protein YfcA [Candidatus Latescibacterota bacterium]|jgi:uncharacterized membrane protein YfcA